MSHRRRSPPSRHRTGNSSRWGHSRTHDRRSHGMHRRSSSPPRHRPRDRSRSRERRRQPSAMAVKSEPSSSEPPKTHHDSANARRRTRTRAATSNLTAMIADDVVARMQQRAREYQERRQRDVRATQETAEQRAEFDRARERRRAYYRGDREHDQHAERKDDQHAERKDDGRAGDGVPQEEPPVEKEQPNWEPTGLLAAEAMTNAHGVVLKYSEPLDRAQPGDGWRVYVFAAGGEPGMTLRLRQSHCLFGRDSLAVHHVLEDTSCSKQHAVIQFRQVNGTVHPYLIDLESTNGTFLNNERVQASRYYQLFGKDTVRFGAGKVDYVLMHEGDAE